MVSVLIMEDLQYTTLKSSLSSVPAKALNYSCRIRLSENLNIKQLLSAKNGYARDYRGLAELMGFQFCDTKNFERSDDPTMKILEAWETRSNAVLSKLIDFLEEMDRHDVIEELVPLLEKDAEAFKQRQESQVQERPIQVPEVTSGPITTYVKRGLRDLLTLGDLRTGECTMYDAYVCYADEDSGFVKKLSDFLESKEIALKLFIRGRDMLAGSPELDTNIELIKNRCRRMLIILTNNFLRSPQCAFQISFAASLSIEQRERILVPIKISTCETPTILIRISTIDFTKPDIYEWMWEKLIMSLLPQGRSPLFFSSLEKFPTHTYGSANSELVVSNESTPMITFPETIKQKALPLNKSSAIITPIEVPVELPSPEVEVPTEIPSIEVPIELSSIEDQTELPSVEVPSERPIELSFSEVTEVPTVDPIKNSNKNPRSTSRTTKLKNTFRAYFRKGRSPTNSSSYSSGATSGFHSESTASDNFKYVNEEFASDTSL